VITPAPRQATQSWLTMLFELPTEIGTI